MVDFRLKSNTKYGVIGVLTTSILSAICVKPVPAIVISRNFNGNGPVISLRKSDTTTDLYVTFGAPKLVVAVTFCGSAASIQSLCKFDNCEMVMGMLKSTTFG